MPKPRLVGLQPEQFRHPVDDQATRSLQWLPGLQLLIQNLLAPQAEKFFYQENLASSLRISAQQLPDLYALHQEACHVLDVEVPELYVRQNPMPNAYTFAMQGQKPFIVIHSSLLDLLEPAEIQAVIGHELGHLKCNHGVYLSMANLLMLSTQLLPFGDLLQQPLYEQLMEWVRCAEFTCDRAALLVTQNAETVVSVLMKLCGGSPKLASQLNVQAFLAQARDYADLDLDEFYVMLKQAQDSNRTHPVPVLRAKEIDRWSRSQSYRTALGLALTRA